MSIDPSEFGTLLKSIHQGEILVPLIRAALWNPDFKSFHVPVGGEEFSSRGPDGWFHPSTHPLWPDRMLYWYLAEPSRFEVERLSPSSVLAVTQGKFWHVIIQRIGIDAGILEDPGICDCCGQREFAVVDQETKSRGHIDGKVSVNVVPEPEVFEFKGLDVNTPIATTHGWKTMLDLQEGDVVFAPDGHPTKVVGAHPVRLGRPCFRITFADGQQVVADDEHFWAVDECVSQRQVRSRVLSTLELAHSDLRTCKRYRYRVAIPSSLQIEDRELPVDPWLLGAWLGDGHSREGVLTVGSEDLDYLIERLESLDERIHVRKDPRGNAYRIGVYGLRTRLGALGVLGSGKKRIPPLYLFASERQRRMLLQGVMDTDGGVTSHQVSVTMKSRLLMEDVCSLVRSLGIRATLRSHRASLNGCDAGEVWRLRLSRSVVRPFLMPRKAAQAEALGLPSLVGRSRYNAIISVEPVETRPTRCITVAHESSMYVVGTGFLPTHNTMKPTRLQRLPLGEPDDPGVVETFKSMAPDYVVQANEYMRMTGYKRWRGVILGMEHPFPMREIALTYDPFLGREVREKYIRVRQDVADARMSPPCCAPGSKQAKGCPARFVCPNGVS